MPKASAEEVLQAATAENDPANSKTKAASTDKPKANDRQFAGMPVSTVEETEFNYNMLIFGDYGSGKTTFSGSAAELEDLSPVLFLDIEGGTLSLKDLYTGIDVIRVTEPKQVTDAWKELRKGQHNYKTVVIDSLTELHKLILRHIMVEVVSEHDHRDEDVPGMQEYLKATQQIRRICRRYRDLPLNTVVTALTMEEEDDKKKKKYTKINLSKKLAGEVGGFFDEVFYIYTKEVDGEEKRLLLTGRTEEIGGKDRTRTLPKVVESPDMKTVFEYFTGEK